MHDVKGGVFWLTVPRLAHLGAEYGQVLPDSHLLVPNLDVGRLLAVQGGEDVGEVVHAGVGGGDELDDLEQRGPQVPEEALDGLLALVARVLGLEQVVDGRGGALGGQLGGVDDVEVAVKDGDNLAGLRGVGALVVDDGLELDLGGGHGCCCC